MRSSHLIALYRQSRQIDTEIMSVFAQQIRGIVAQLAPSGPEIRTDSITRFLLRYLVVALPAVANQV